MGEAIVIAAVVIGLIFGCFLLWTTVSPVFDETSMTQTQTLTFDGKVQLCGQAGTVKNGSCNVQVTGLKETPSATGYVVTATNKDEKCDSRTSVDDGECNGKATVLDKSFDAGLGLGGLFVVLGLLTLLVIVIAGAFA